MIVGYNFHGDTNDHVKNIQHDHYSYALQLIIEEAERLKRISETVLDLISYESSLNSRPIDHRCLQDAHDLLAAAARYKIFPTQRDLFSKSADPNIDQVVREWLDWLRSLLLNYQKSARMVGLIIIIIDNQNSDIGYAAEESLMRVIMENFGDIPWLRKQ